MLGLGFSKVWTDGVRSTRADTLPPSGDAMHSRIAAHTLYVLLLWMQCIGVDVTHWLNV